MMGKNFNPNWTRTELGKKNLCATLSHSLCRCYVTPFSEYIHEVLVGDALLYMQRRKLGCQVTGPLWEGVSGIQSVSVGIQNACLFCIMKTVYCGKSLL